MTALINPWIAGGVAGYAAVLVFALALCKAAARGDQMWEEIAEAERDDS